jgi:hypothetical protein
MSGINWSWLKDITCNSIVEFYWIDGKEQRVKIVELNQLNNSLKS